MAAAPRGQFPRPYGRESRPVRRLLVMVLIIGVLVLAPGVGAQQFDLLRVTCSDFPSQAAAQAADRADPIGLSNLDRDKDGIACESNPGPYDYRRPGEAPAPQPPSPPTPPAPTPAPEPEPHCTFYAE